MHPFNLRFIGWGTSFPINLYSFLANSATDCYFCQLTFIRLPEIAFIAFGSYSFFNFTPTLDLVEIHEIRITRNKSDGADTRILNL